MEITVASGASPDTTTRYVLTASREFLETAERATSIAVPTTVDQGRTSHNLMVAALRELTAASRWEVAEIGNYGELLTIIGNYETRVATLETQLANQRRISDRLSLLGGDGHAGSKPESIPDPIPFDGTRTALRPFLNQLRNKIQGNATKFPDAQHEMRYAFGFLKGAAYDVMEPHMQDHGMAFQTLAEFAHVLRTAFGDPDELHTARREIDTLQQKNREFSLYYSDFQRLMATLQWADNAKFAALEKGLSKEIKDGLALQDSAPEETFDQYVARINRLDTRLRARRQETRAPQTSASNRPAPTRAPPATPPTPPQGTTDVGTHSGPMNLSANRRRITQQERTRRISQGLCLYCGGTGHFAQECPYRPQNPLRGAEAQVVDPAAAAGTAEPAGNE